MRKGSISLHFRGAGLLLLMGTLALGCATTAPPGPGPADRQKARSHYDMASSHLVAGRTALAVREFLAATRLDPEDPWIHHGLAEAYRRKGRLEDAEIHLKRALQIRPGFHEAQLNLSALYVQMERFEEAVVVSQKLADDPTFPAPWRGLTNLGWAQFKVGKVEEARRSLQLAVDFHPNYWPALLNLGILESERARPLEAMTLFKRVIEIGPGMSAAAEVNYRIAELYVRLGRREDALRHLTAVAEGGTRGRWAKQSAEYLELLQ